MVTPPVDRAVAHALSRRPDRQVVPAVPVQVAGGEDGPKPSPRSRHRPPRTCPPTTAWPRRRSGRPGSGRDHQAVGADRSPRTVKSTWARARRRPTPQCRHTRCASKSPIASAAVPRPPPAGSSPVSVIRIRWAGVRTPDALPWKTKTCPSPPIATSSLPSSLRSPTASRAAPPSGGLEVGRCRRDSRLGPAVEVHDPELRQAGPRPEEHRCAAETAVVVVSTRPPPGRHTHRRSRRRTPGSAPRSGVGRTRPGRGRRSRACVGLGAAVEHAHRPAGRVPVLRDRLRRSRRTRRSPRRRTRPG